MNQPPFPEMESQRFYERLRLIFEVRNMKILFCMTIQVFFMTKPNLKGSREFLKDIQIFQQDFNQMAALIDGNTGIYTLDGHITFEELGFRLFGPTYFHNPYGPFEKVRPLDAVSLTAVTTHTIKPQESPQDPNVLPNEAIDHAREMYKINLTDSAHVNPPLCEGTVKNKTINGKVLSTWRYLAPLLSKDPEGKIPAGCPQDDPKISGGTAFLHGRPVDHETGVVTFVTAMHIGSSNDLTFAFKEVPIFIIFNGWVCNPNGDPENFEGERCYDMMQNERDEVGQISILE